MLHPTNASIEKDGKTIYCDRCYSKIAYMNNTKYKLLRLNIKCGCGTDCRVEYGGHTASGDVDLTGSWDYSVRLKDNVYCPVCGNKLVKLFGKNVLDVQIKFICKCGKKYNKLIDAGKSLRTISSVSLKLDEQNLQNAKNNN